MAATIQDGDDSLFSQLMTPTNLALGGAALAVGAYMLSDGGEDNRRINASPSTYSKYGEGPHWCTERDGEMKIKYSRNGISNQPATTVIDIFQKSASASKSKVAWRREGSPGQWETCIWSKHYDNCVAAAKSMLALGMNHHDSINIIGFNSWQWITANLGCILMGGIPAGQYGTNQPGQARYIAKHCQAKLIFLDGAKQLEKWVEIHAECPELRGVVCWNVDNNTKNSMKGSYSIPIYSFDEFMQLGKDVQTSDLEEIWSKVRPGNCCTLIYTSGTTGNPKAVMMTHDNLIWGSYNILNSSGMGKTNHRVVSYLPLSHVAAQMMDIYGPIAMSTSGKNWAECWFARPDALKGSLKHTLIACKPTIFFGVPRVWEKFKEGIQKKAKAKKSFLVQALVDFAKNKCKRRNDSMSKSEGGCVKPFGYGFGSTLMNKLVLANLGLDQCLFFVTGAAPIARDTLEYFKNLDVFIDEVYGMSESGGAVTLGRLYHREMGSTGPAIDGCEVKLEHVAGRDKDGEGEICFRGRNIMMGYLGQPKKTQESIDDEGFMHSGDVGRFDEYGCLYITGRIKELLITEGGENIAPVPIEKYIKAKLRGLANVIMIGDKRKFCSLLVSLKTKVDMETELPTDELDLEALEVSDGVTTVQQAMNDETWQKYIQAGIDAYNTDREACVSRATTIKKFRILPQDLSRAQGTLGPTLKVKRPEVYRIHDEVIDSMYQF